MVNKLPNQPEVQLFIYKTCSDMKYVLLAQYTAYSANSEDLNIIFVPFILGKLSLLLCQ